MGPLIVAKREEREEAMVDIASTSNKRQKIDETEAGDEKNRVDTMEMDSAFALASLASLATMSPQRPSTVRPIDETTQISTSMSMEGRAPNDDPVPISPELRSPAQRGHKRVTFDPEIVDRTRLTSRKLSCPPRINHGSRMPMGFARAQGMPRNLPPSAWGIRPRTMPGMIPPMMMQSHPPNQWICDFCNMASFPTFQEACIHEGLCRARMAMSHGSHPMFHPGGQGGQAQQMIPLSPGASTQQPDALLSSTTRNWSQGVASLALAKTDHDWLSPLNCYIRGECVEVFSASGEEVTKVAKRGRVSLHQVGIRCRFCKHRTKDERQTAAVSYPQSVAGIYESVKRWQRLHAESCEDIPEAVQVKLQSLSSSNAWIPTTRQYWADSARTLGMVDTDDGIRFTRDPTTLGSINGIGAVITSTISNDSASVEGVRALADGKSIVHPMDMNMVPPYVFFLTSQVESCHFTEADRFVARSRCPVGYPGFQCRHCNGHAGLGKYFPITSKSLATNSTSQNIHAHLLKCRKCPSTVKEQLVALKEEKGKAPRLEPGWRKLFFDKIWSRLHG